MIRLSLMLILFVTQISAQNIDTFRNNYILAVDNKSICEKMINDLENHQDIAIYKAYLGAYQTIWANHIFNPIAKLNTFKKGKLNLESAIKSDFKNIEIRFLRYTIQSKAPKFLGYHNDIEMDRLFILSNRKTVKEESLNQLIKHVN